MKNSLLLCTVILAACGYSSAGNTLEGQVKRVIRKTPIICPDYYEADVSLGVLRNGVGSLSKEDVSLYVTRAADVLTLQDAARSGAIVAIGYSVKRVTVCVPDHWLTSVQVEAPFPTGPAKP